MHPRLGLAVVPGIIPRNHPLRLAVTRRPRRRVTLKSRGPRRRITFRRIPRMGGQVTLSSIVNLLLLQIPLPRWWWFGAVTVITLIILMPIKIRVRRCRLTLTVASRQPTPLLLVPRTKAASFQ